MPASPAGWPAWRVTLLAAVLISVIIASLSNALALLLRQQEALIGISQFIVLPLQFLSSAIMDRRAGAGVGADDRALQPGRLGGRGGAARRCPRRPTGPSVWSRLGLLVAVAAVMAWLATRAFGTYQRSL